MVSALERIPSEPIDIEAGASDDEDPPAAAGKVDQPLKIISPGTVFVDFVEDNRPSGGELATQDPFAMFRHVPVEIILFSRDEAAGQCGLSNLPRPGDEDHFMSQISLHLVGQVTRFHGELILLFYTKVKNTRAYFADIQKTSVY
jgi:hypothetical protein